MWSLLPPPFELVTDQQMENGDVPNLHEALAVCPAKYKNRHTWQALAEHLSTETVTRPEAEALVELITVSPNMAVYMQRYIRALSVSTVLNAEDKYRLMGWCLSAWLAEPPEFIRAAGDAARTRARSEHNGRKRTRA